jgi:hypothetical protein
LIIPGQSRDLPAATSPLSLNFLAFAHPPT